MAKKYLDNTKDVYPIILFSDDFEAGCALGSHSGEQALCGIYASLPCLPPHLLAKMENVFLSSVCHTKYIKLCKKKFFSKTIEDVNFLSEEGLNLIVDSVQIKIYFGCVLLAGDNKALNEICGFVGSFQANYFCRICYASKCDCKKMVREIKSKLRRKDLYQSDVEINDQSVTGIKELCIMNDIHKFHIYENISGDKMHDWWQGGGKKSMENILHGLIASDDNKLTLNILNSRIKTFDYNETEQGNKPRPIYYESSKKGFTKLKLRQSASETLCLVRYLGLMIGDIIPHNNKYWRLYRYLRELSDIIESPRLREGEISSVSELIQNHNELYIELFGELIPKMHFFLHYERLIRLYGPVVHFSSDLFERKNKN